MKNIFIIGSKGIPAKYGGFETFVDQLTKHKVNKDISYHVSCLSEDNDKEFFYNNTRCFNIKVPSIGSARAVLYDILSLKESINYIERKNINNCIIYILACRIGPFIPFYKKRLKKLGIKLYLNPDGHEWKRSKWNSVIRNYWKFSERLMVKYSDLLICDSKGIESYIQAEYEQYHPKTTFIAYGADVTKSEVNNNDNMLIDWQEKFNIKANEYYLIVGRFVPENNYKLMIEEFMQSNSHKDLVIISNVEQNDFYNDLLNKTKFDKDKRVKFVGTVYNQQLLKKIREQAYGYIHGHEVGGTNPSLLEALASTKLNLLLNVVFNKEVGGEGAFYFTKKEGSLTHLINRLDKLIESDILDIGDRAKQRITSEYSWEKIVSDYEKVFK
jgi:rhamnosyltransferase